MNDTPSTPRPGPPPGRRGRLTVYFGAAPGVGKTYAMLDEAHRRRTRGVDVVVGYVETHGRAPVVALLEGLEVLPRQELTYRGQSFTELDTQAVLRRSPRVVLVDELAHTNVPGSAHARRWQDVEELLDAGMDVVTTVNVQHLESLNDDVEAVTGVRQRETVPDHVVRQAYQIQLIDLAPEALRRRLAHGNIYRADQIDASLSSYFRLGNLTALRELALLWLADRVDDALISYRREHAISRTWPTRERVVVAVTGGPESETLIRRGARIAQRAAGSELLAVHVLSGDGLPAAAPATLEAQRRLVEELDGSFHTVIGEDTAAAVVDFAAAVNATMIVVGVSRRSRWVRVLTESVGTEIARLAETVDVHLVTHEQARRGRRRPNREARLPFSRTLAGWALAVAGPVALTAVLHLVPESAGLSTEILLYLALTVGVALVGGLWPALFAAVAAFLALNFFFTAPTGRLTVADPHNLLALGVFVVVAAAVASVVHLAVLRSAQAARARAEASALAQVARSVLEGEDTAESLVSRVREAFTLESVALLARDGARWRTVATSGSSPPRSPEEADTVATVDPMRVLALRGHSLHAGARRVLEAFATQAGNILEYRRLREQAEQARLLEHAEATRTALLAAVSHDLRTPLATIRTSIDGLLAPDIRLGAADTADLTRTVADATARLERLIDNLLDLSRLQTGSVAPVLRAASLDEIVPLATEGLATAAVRLDVPETLPLVLTDPGLLERVIANVVSNAVRHAPAGAPVLVNASATDAHVEVRVVDTGPGVSEDRKEHLFEPFQRLGDTSSGGLGLGLAVAHGLAGAVGAEISAEDTPGGGLTMVLTVPVAGRRAP
ncbi:ATP-binding protein [Georgenia wutianyii]|uniref:ATP-binding protein n=1 Tax=Georgenia wutianyii TaxID=2585135 RepID=UPI0022AAB63A|nr:ATP-binding protein [Georgenia wutianyii]